jgi:hypothetical protein
MTGSRHFDSESHRGGRISGVARSSLGVTVETLVAEYFGELSQKYRYAIVELSSRGARRLPLSDFQSAARDEFFTVCA